MADDPRPRRRRGKRKRSLIVAAAVLSLAGIVAAKPLYHQLKARRADRLSAEAEQLVAQRRLAEAAAKYRSALKLDPFGYRPLRGAAALATSLHHSEALGLWQEVAASPRATAEDREQYAAALLQAGALPEARKVIDRLLQANPSTRALLLAATYSAAIGNSGKAIEYARLAAKRAPNDDAAQARLAEMLAASQEETDRAEAKQILWRVARAEHAAKKGAIEALARAPELTPAEQMQLLEMVRALSPFGVSEALLAADLELRLHPENATAIYDEVVARWTADEAGRVAVARWLNLHGQSDRVLDVAPVDTRDPALLLARLDALATQKRWSEIEGILARPRLGFDATVIESFRARAAQEQRSPLDAEFHWSKAIAAAKGDPQKLRFVANFAEQSGAAEAALRAFDQLARSPENALIALAGQQRLMEKAHDITAARDIAQKALALKSTDPDALNRLLYYNLLLKQDVKSSAAKAKELTMKFPNRLEFRVTAALGCLREHNAAGALAQFHGPPIDWSKTPPAWRAVYAATLMVNEQAERATEITRTIKREHLSPEEAALVADAGSVPQ